VNTKNNRIFFYAGLLTILATILMGFKITPALANSLPFNTEENSRIEIISIAEEYALHQWDGTVENILHAPYDDDADRYINGVPIELNLLAQVPIDTPDGLTSPNQNYEGYSGWWLASENTGIPYGWGGFDSIGNFDTKISNGFPAGNINTTSNSGGFYTTGVDCEGLIERAWGFSTRYGMSQAQTVSRPVQAVDLRAGDVLMSLASSGSLNSSHIILFKSFENFNGEDIVLYTGSNGTAATKINTIEASYTAGKVVEKVYYITGLVSEPVDVNNPKNSNDNPELFFKGKQFATDRITLTAVDTLEGPSAPNGTPLEFIPRTYLNRLTLMIVIDVSGSIDDLTQARQAAMGLIYNLRPGDSVGVITFDSSADVVYPLTRVDTNAQKKTIIDLLPVASSGGSTAINAGLITAYNNLLVYHPDDANNHNQHVWAPGEEGEALTILLSDGQSPEIKDRSPSDSFFATIDAYKSINVPIWTIGIGYNNEIGFLSRLAEETGGEYLPDFNSSTYAYVMGRLLDFFLKIDNSSESLVSPVISSTVPSEGSTAEHVVVDSTMGSLSLSFNKPAGNISMTLKKPGGSIVSTSDPSVSYISGSTYDMYKIQAPESGTWTMEISGTSGSAYSISASTWAAMDISVESDKDVYAPGNPIKLTASIKDTSILSGPANITGTVISVVSESPSSAATSFELYDDGAHGDGAANDGEYANAFTNTNNQGDYNFDIQFSGVNKDGQPFVRKSYISRRVNNFPYVTSITRASADNTSYNVKYSVSFSEPVVGVDPSDFEVITTGDTLGIVTEVSGSGAFYTVSVGGQGTGTLRLDLTDNDTIKDLIGSSLIGMGTDDGSFTAGQVYNKIASTDIVSKLADTNDGVCDADCSLREAVASVAPGEEVTFSSSLSGETIHLASTLELSGNLMIDASSLALPITISGDTNNDGTGNVRVINVATNAVVILKDLIISKGYAATTHGAGINNSGNLTIINSIVSNNIAAQGAGGGIYSVGVLTILNSSITNNAANNTSGANGGGIYNGGSLTLNNSTVSNNTAYLHGGGIFSGNPDWGNSLNILNSTIANNSINGNGGGIWHGYGEAVIVNSTIFGNTAAGRGGGVYNSNYRINLLNDTISGNSATISGGGLFNQSTLSDAVKFSNSLIANSVLGGDCVVSANKIAMNINNLVEDAACSASFSGDPNLDILANNGGSTQTMALLEGSTAIDAGDAVTCANSAVGNLDQRGVSRLQGVACDIGAYETGGLPSVGTLTPTITPTRTSTSTKAPTRTPALTYTLTLTSTPTITKTPTITNTPTITYTPTETPTITPTATPYPNILLDDFDTTTLSTFWEWYVPKAGPTYSLSAVPGSLRMSLPAYDSFEHWGEANDSPQLRLRNFGSGDWAIETRLENVEADPNAGYWAAIEVGFSESDYLWYGIVDDGYLKSNRVSEGEYFAVEQNLPITLRMEKVGNAYTFMYKSDSDLDWTIKPTVNSTGTPTYVSLIGRGFWTGSTPMYMDWSYFRVENWSAATPTPIIPTATNTPTQSLTPSITPTASMTLTPSITPTPSITLTPSITTEPSITLTPSITPTASITPTGMPFMGVVVDEFDETLLDPDWEWYLPADGPSYSLSAEPGQLQVIVPPGYDHWIWDDNAPQVRRSDMGDGDWAIETYISLDDTNNAGGVWEINLVAGFGRYDQQWLTIDGNNFMRVARVDEEGNTAAVSDISLPLYLRMERSGTNYTFKYKEELADPWIILDVQSMNDPVEYVGLQFRTVYGDAGDAVFNVDYFRLERSNPTSGPVKQIEEDDFNSLSLDGDWSWYVPKSGPSYSLTDVPGSFRMSLPANDSFEHWTDVDDAPQLRRTDLGSGDWAIETQLTNIDATDAGYWAALEVGFDQFDQIWYGMVDDGYLKINRLSEGEHQAVDQDLSLILRLEKHGEKYIFKYRQNPNEAWTVLAPKTYLGTPTYVGLIGRGFSTGTTEMHIDWSYFRLERWTP
jgi:CSLREA domain-containing protein